MVALMQRKAADGGSPMPRGGARNRSGPQADPNSGRSDRKGLTFRVLPVEGYQDEPPAFPLPMASTRELELWTLAWQSPQAVAWAEEPWRWYTVGEWVRWSVKAEAEDAPAALVAATIRLKDQLGLTPAGLKENGWTIGSAESAAPALEQLPASVVSIKDRLPRGGA